MHTKKFLWLILLALLATPSVADHETGRDIYLYRPNYIIMAQPDGLSDEDFILKFQYSTRAQLLEVGRVSLNLGYTQKSFWDIADTPGPFLEHNFNPDVMLRWEFDRSEFDRLAMERFQIGWEHESNGVAGGNSRGWDRISAEARFAFRTGLPGMDFPGPWTGTLLLYPKVWLPPFRDGDSPSLVDTYKYGQIGGALRIDCEHDTDLGILPVLSQGEFFRLGYQINAHSYQLEPAIRLWFLDRLVNYQGFYLYGQWFSGRGESLLRADNFDERFGLGILILKRGEL